MFAQTGDVHSMNKLELFVNLSQAKYYYHGLLLCEYLSAITIDLYCVGFLSHLAVNRSCQNNHTQLSAMIH